MFKCLRRLTWIIVLVILSPLLLLIAITVCTGMDDLKQTISECVEDTWFSDYLGGN